MKGLIYLLLISVLTTYAYADSKEEFTAYGKSCTPIWSLPNYSEAEQDADKQANLACAPKLARRISNYEEEDMVKRCQDGGTLSAIVVSYATYECIENN